MLFGIHWDCIPEKNFLSEVRKLDVEGKAVIPDGLKVSQDISGVPNAHNLALSFLLLISDCLKCDSRAPWPGILEPSECLSPLFSP